MFRLPLIAFVAFSGILSSPAFAEPEAATPDLRSVFDRDGVKAKGEDLKKQFEERLQDRDGGLSLQLNPQEERPSLVPAGNPVEGVFVQDHNNALPGVAPVQNVDEDKGKKSINEREIQGRIKIDKSILYDDEDVRNVNIVYSAWLETQKFDDEQEDIKMEGEAGDIISSILEKIEDQKLREQEASGEIVKKQTVFNKLPAYFYLDSIIYRNHKNRAIWLNGNKMLPDSKLGGLKVNKIAKDKVTFEWYVEDIRANLNRWARQAELTRSLTGEKIEVDPINRIVKFSLQPNQIFDVENMIVLEGARQAEIVSEMNEIFYDPKKPDTRRVVIEEKILNDDSGNKSDKKASGSVVESIDADDFIRSDEEILREMLKKEDQ